MKLISEVGVSPGVSHSGTPSATDGAATLAFETFAAAGGERLRRVLVAHFGIDVGEEVTADALAWGWEHWDDLAVMTNPVGYLYRVAQSSARRYRRWERRVVLPPEACDELHAPEPGLQVALARISAPQRVAIVLVHALGWTYAEAADAMDVPITTVRNHLHRGLQRLRRELGEGS